MNQLFHHNIGPLDLKSQNLFGIVNFAGDGTAPEVDLWRAAISLKMYHFWGEFALICEEMEGSTDQVTYPSGAFT